MQRNQTVLSADHSNFFNMIDMMFFTSYHDPMKIEPFIAPADDTRIRRGPTVAEIAAAAGVGTATVDRVLNGRSKGRSVTRQKIMQALSKLTAAASASEPSEAKPIRVAFLCDSGESFHTTLESAVQNTVLRWPEMTTTFEAITTSQVDPIKFANMIERAAEHADALVIVAREDLTISRVVRNLIDRNMPVICLTTDFRTADRTAYVGNDQISAGATAACLMGQAVGNREGNILLVYSAAYRCQEERELGFRRVLRAEYPLLRVEERVNSQDDTEYVYRNVVRYIEDHGPPAGIYNVAAGNIGVGKALQQFGLAGKTVFIGHELNANSRLLLETGVMNIVIGHDVAEEVELALNCVKAAIAGKQVLSPPRSRVLIHAKYNCI